ncbi:MAG: GNAT family N-acetyltransferase [Saprospiraceae bacterium]|nr:GNAT family N-acetyltransferase [Lewinellaceae bacterium]
MIRPYTHADKPQVIHLLRLNTPHYFAEAEEADLLDYLDRHLEDYFVVEEQGVVVGAGGINYFPEAQLARISWDIIHSGFQGKGIGSALTRHRIDMIRENPAIAKIVVRTSQHVYKFYEKNGFTLEKTAADFWAPGYDLYQMVMYLDTAAGHTPQMIK